MRILEIEQRLKQHGEDIMKIKNQLVQIFTLLATLKGEDENLGEG